jgi:endonuclease/exonuclease/phosphatase (EEP) superfamily protein YafD
VPQLTPLLEELDQLWTNFSQEGRVLLFGDLNAELSPNLSHDRSTTGIAVATWIREHSARILNTVTNERFERTHLRHSGNQGRTLDYILASGWLRATAYSAPSTRLNLNFGSDHLLLHGRVNVKLQQRGQAKKKKFLQLHLLK